MTVTLKDLVEQGPVNALSVTLYQLFLIMNKLKTYMNVYTVIQSQN